MADFLEFYSRKNIQKAILEASKNREIAVKYSTGGFGKRPDILNFENDVFELAKSGATSFHISEEHWSNPLLLKPGMTKNELDKLRIGFDLIIDVDTKFIDYSKLTASLIIEALKFHNLKSIGLKFSGGSGFHIGIPFSALPSQVNNIEIRLLFPDAPRVIAAYLKTMIQSPLRDKILEISTLQEISKSIDKPQKELLQNNKFNPFSVVDIDTVLISNRHMYRSPYSINEKKGLVSIPIEPEELSSFNLKKARMENIKSVLPFLPKVKEKEASSLVVQAFDTLIKSPSLNLEIKSISKNYEALKTSISADYFPLCIQKLLQGIKQDGRKRALFILTNFLRHMNYSIEAIEKILLDWDKRNYQPLKEIYIKSQLNWHKRQSSPVLPPNCDNESYYKALGIKCTPECLKYKNPVNYAKKRFFAHLKNSKLKKRK